MTIIVVVVTIAGVNSILQRGLRAAGAAAIIASVGVLTSRERVFDILLVTWWRIQGHGRGMELGRD